MDQGGSFSTIDYPGAIYTAALGINSSQQISGYYYVGANGPSHGFLYSAGSFTSVDVPGAMYTICWGINDGPEVACSYGDESGNEHGVLYRQGIFSEVDFPNSTFTELTGINNKHQMVGIYEPAGASRSYGFLATPAN